MAKYLRIASDLHLEAWKGRNIDTLIIDFLPADPRDKDSILILAGDISSDPNQLMGFLFAAEKKFEQVIYVAGNHEAYRHDLNAWNDTMRDRFQTLENTFAVNLSDVKTFEHSGIRFVVCALWGDGDTVEKQLWVDRGLNDFRVIRNGESRFTVYDMMDIHKRQKKELVNFLKTPFGGKTVVVTHHMPSYRLCHPRFDNEINGGFASNCDDILAYDHAPVIWIHGHTHDTGDGKLWSTRIICNPAGYRGEWDTPFNQYIAAPKFVELNV